MAAAGAATTMDARPLHPHFAQLLEQSPYHWSLRPERLGEVAYSGPQFLGATPVVGNSALREVVARWTPPLAVLAPEQHFYEAPDRLFDQLRLCLWPHAHDGWERQRRTFSNVVRWFFDQTLRPAIAIALPYRIPLRHTLRTLGSELAYRPPIIHAQPPDGVSLGFRQIVKPSELFDLTYRNHLRRDRPCAVEMHEHAVSVLAHGFQARSRGVTVCLATKEDSGLLHRGLVPALAEWYDGTQGIQAAPHISLARVILDGPLKQRHRVSLARAFVHGFSVTLHPCTGSALRYISHFSSLAQWVCTEPMLLSMLVQHGAVVWDDQEHG